MNTALSKSFAYGVALLILLLAVAVCYRSCALTAPSEKPRATETKARQQHTSKAKVAEPDAPLPPIEEWPEEVCQISEDGKTARVFIPWVGFFNGLVRRNFDFKTGKTFSEPITLQSLTSNPDPEYVPETGCTFDLVVTDAEGNLLYMRDRQPSNLVRRNWMSWEAARKSLPSHLGLKSNMEAPGGLSILGKAAASFSKNGQLWEHFQQFAHQPDNRFVREYWPVIAGARGSENVHLLEAQTNDTRGLRTTLHEDGRETPVGNPNLAYVGLSVFEQQDEYFVLVFDQPAYGIFVEDYVFTPAEEEMAKKWNWAELYPKIYKVPAKDPSLPKK